MRSFHGCLCLTLVACLGTTGCNFKIPTWSELQGTAPAATSEPSPPPQQPVQTIAEPPKPPEPDAIEVIAKFKALPPSQIDDGKLNALYNLKEGLETITEIDASGSSVGNYGLTGIAKLTGLRQLLLSNTKIDDGALNALAQSQSIEVLKLSGTAIKGGSLGSLHSMSNLKLLVLDGCKLAEDAWEQIGTLTTLEELSIANTPVTNQAMESICRSKSLKHLTLNNTGITDEGLVPLQNLDSLEGLDVGYCRITGEGLQFLAQGKGLKNLKRLSLANNNTLTQAGANLLCKMHTLEALYMARVQGVNDLFLKQIVSANPSMTVMNIGFAGVPGSITDKGLIAVSSAKRLQVVDARGIPTLSDLTLKALVKCKDLTEVTIDGGCTILGAQAFKKARPDCKLTCNGVKY